MKFPIKTIKRNNQIVALPKNTLEVSKLVKFAKKINEFKIKNLFKSGL